MVDAYPTPADFDEGLTWLFYDLATYSQQFDADDEDGTSTAYGKGKFNTARYPKHASDAFPAGTSVSRVEWWKWSSADGRALYYRTLTENSDYAVVHLTPEDYHVYFYRQFWDQVGLLDKFNFVFSDPSSKLLQDADNANGDVFAEPLQYTYQPNLQARAIGYVAALYQLFWDRTHPSQDISVSVAAAPTSQGLSFSVDGDSHTSYSATWQKGESHILAVPTPQTGDDDRNYSFLKWQDEDTSNPRTVAPTSDCAYTAIFASSGPVAHTANSSADAILDEFYRTSNFGQLTEFGVCGYPAGNRLCSVLKFNLSSIPVGSTVESVDLQLYARRCYNPNNRYTFLFHSLFSSWNETSVTWSNQPSVDAAPALRSYKQFSGTGVHSWLSADFPNLISTVQGWVNGSSANNGFELVFEDGYEGDSAYLLQRIQRQ